MRRWLAGLFVLVAQLLASAACGEQCVPDELLVKFRPGTPAPVRAAVYHALGGRVRGRVGALDVDVVGLPAGIAPEHAAALCARSPAVQYAEPNPICVTTGVPNDALYGQEWGMDKIQAPLAWNVTQGDPGVVIAIVDSGIALDHEDLASKIVASQNFSDSDTADDLFGHGTHLAGIAAAVADNGVGIAGLGNRCSLMNVKVSRDADGKGAASWVAQGLTWAADSGARVICMSFGAPTSSRTVEAAVDYAWNHGAVLVASAGNGGGSGLNYPAAYPNCISVAATDPSDGLMAGSSFGAWVDVAAPGANILSTLPNRPNAFRAQGYGTAGGTSQATAFVAGLAGLIWSSPFGGSNAAVRARIEATCDRIPGTGTLWANGRINAARAVGAIQ
jgi:thermitase